MMKNRALACMLPLAALVVFGCQEPNSLESAGSKAGSKAVSTPTEKELLVRLQAADKLDGNEDKTVHRCYVCNLGMDGKEVHSAEHLGYTAHLCSSGCLAQFKKDPEAVIAETAIPTEKGK